MCNIYIRNRVEKGHTLCNVSYLHSGKDPLSKIIRFISAESGFDGDKVQHLSEIVKDNKLKRLFRVD